MDYLFLPEPLSSTKNGELEPSTLNWNSIVEFNGEKYRERIECLIVRDTTVFISFYKDGYLVPGGSTEPDKGLKYQLHEECNQEAVLKIKEPQYVCTIKRSFIDNRRNSKALFLRSRNYPNQSLSYLYIAKFNGVYKGEINPYDLDSRVRKGRFYNYFDVRDKLIPAHKYALDKYFKVL